MEFGKQIKQLRLDGGLSLRKFTEAIGQDASNWSKIERGTIHPPSYNSNPEIFDKICNVLALSSKQYYDLINVASVDRMEIPSTVCNDKEILDALPIFFSAKPTREQLESLIEILKRR